MSVITFSTRFPAKHPKAGEPTLFVEKVCESLFEMGLEYPLQHIPGEIEPKHHTIRAGNRWKVGDWFSPRIWSGKPYASKQIEFAPPIQIKKVWDFEVSNSLARINNEIVTTITFSTLSKNDGLDEEDLEKWLQIPKPFKGQIICWNELIEY